MQPHVLAAGTSTTGWVVGYTIGIVIVLVVKDGVNDVAADVVAVVIGEMVAIVAGCRARGTLLTLDRLAVADPLEVDADLVFFRRPGVR